MDFFQQISDFFQVDIYNYAVDASYWLLNKIILFQLRTMIFFVTYAWGYVSTILETLQIASRFASTLQFLPVGLKANLEFFNVFTGLGWISQSYGTRMVLKFLKIS